MRKSLSRVQSSRASRILARDAGLLATVGALIDASE